MRIIIARHGDPDYEHDSLTAKGDVEAKYLAKELGKLKVKKIYSSPLGRAKRTASFTADKLKMDLDVRSWLQEFPGKCEKPNRQGIVEYCWDWLPADWTAEPLFYDKDKWVDAPAFEGTNIREEWDKVRSGMDELLSENGYVRDGLIYRAERPNDDTILIFCHLGVEAVMVGYMLGISPMVLWHGFVPAPSSVTEIVTEERVEGIANFRTKYYGSTFHLYKHGEEPSFAARFCELYTNYDERH